MYMKHPAMPRIAPCNAADCMLRCIQMAFSGAAHRFCVAGAGRPVKGGKTKTGDLLFIVSCRFSLWAI